MKNSDLKKELSRESLRRRRDHFSDVMSVLVMQPRKAFFYHSLRTLALRFDSSDRTSHEHQSVAEIK